MIVRLFKRLTQLLIIPFLLLSPLSSIIINPSSVSASSLDENQVFLPQVFVNWPPIPTTLTINPIDNSDQDNLFTVSWIPGENIDSYSLDESLSPDFPAPVAEYQLNSPSWSPETGKFPGTFYYRVKGINQYNSGVWSSTQSVTVYPLFVGLKIRMDGYGYVRGSEYYDIGTHATYQFNALTDGDTIREDGQMWYDPNPLSFDPETWVSYFSPTTGLWKASNVPPDPSWKWNGESFRLDYNFQYKNGITVILVGQKFNATGPIDGYNSSAQPIKYWQFVNQDKFLYYDNGGDWKQYVHPGDIILRYDANGSKLELSSNVLRRYYNKGNLTSDTVQYIETLTSSTSIPGSPPFSPSVVNQSGVSQSQKLKTYGMFDNH